jgi:3-deoxy-manno-octulosonate cytidylyltransferase (CMP-KDO synthetase)
MSTLAVIPARLGATRLPQKPLRLLGGEPLIARVWERVNQMRVADRVIVATDAAQVADACRALGAEVIMTRADHASGTDRVAEVAAKREFASFRIIVNVQGDEPYVPSAAVEGAVDLVASDRFAIGTAAAESDDDILDDANIVKVVTADDGRALYFSRAPIPYLRDAADASLRARLVRRHLGVYAYRRDALATFVSLPPHPLELTERLEQLRALAAGIPMGVAGVGKVTGGGIDTEEDLALANARWSDNHTTPR